MKEKYVIGLMSGTSADGIDASLIKIKPNFSFEEIFSKEFPFDKNLKKKIFSLFNPNVSLKNLCEMNFLLGEYFADATIKLCKEINFDLKKVDLIGSHGQTIFHNPTNDKYNSFLLKSTLQIGELSVIAKRTGITTIGDFRTDDISLNGQGAPLVPFFDKLFFSKDNIPKVIQNLGGIGNATIISPKCEIFAFDTGPANILIDYFSKKLFNQDFDKNGEIANQGSCNKAFLSYLMNNNYFEKSPPKSTGRELFNFEYAEKIYEYAPKNNYDVITTITEFTIQSIKNQYEKYIFPKTNIKEIVLGGGGAYNSYIKKRLFDVFDKKIQIKTHEDYNISNKFKEAIAFAFLAYARFYEIHNNIPSCTGASQSTSMGKIVLP